MPRIEDKYEARRLAREFARPASEIEAMLALGFATTDINRWIRDRQADVSNLLGVTIWIYPEGDPREPSSWAVAIGIDTDAREDALHESLNANFDSPVEAAKFALDEFRLALASALEALH